jgi:hypothetical protein
MALPECVLVVHTKVPPEQEDAFNRWYDDVHLPEITNCPGFLRSARYVTQDDSGRQYLALYELENETALESDLFSIRRGLGPFTGEAEISVQLFKQRITIEHEDEGVA